MGNAQSKKRRSRYITKVVSFVILFFFTGEIYTLSRMRRVQILNQYSPNETFENSLSEHANVKMKYYQNELNE